MKIAWYIVLLVALAGLSAWIYSRSAEAERMARAAEYQRIREADEKAEMEAAEKERRKKEEEAAKDKAVTMLQGYLEREKKRLKDIVEQCHIAMETIDLDQKDLSDAIAEIEKKNAQIAEDNRRRNIKRFDKAERVSMILKDPMINSLANKYLGEDLTATYAKYKSEVSTELKRYQESESRLRKNRAAYYKAVEGADEWLDKRNQKARKQNDAVIRSAEMELAILERELRPLQKEYDTLVKQTEKMRSHYHEKRMEELKNKIGALEDKMRPARIQLETIRAQAAHMDATEGETIVRRKYNTAQEARDDADNDVHKDSAHEVAMYQTAARYENATLDKIRMAMKLGFGKESDRCADANKKLNYISRSVANIDFLTAAEVEEIRAKVVEELSEGLTARDSEE